LSIRSPPKLFATRLQKLNPTMTVYIHLLALLIFSLEIGFKQLRSILIRYTNSIVSHTKCDSNIGDRIFNIEKWDFKID
jgi:hypothetical protein